MLHSSKYQTNKQNYVNLVQNNLTNNFESGISRSKYIPPHLRKTNNTSTCIHCNVFFKNCKINRNNDDKSIEGEEQIAKETNTCLELDLHYRCYYILYGSHDRSLKSIYYTLLSAVKYSEILIKMFNRFIQNNSELSKSIRDNMQVSHISLFYGLDRFGSVEHVHARIILNQETDPTNAIEIKKIIANLRHIGNGDDLIKKFDGYFPPKRVESIIGQIIGQTIGQTKKYPWGKDWDYSALDDRAKPNQMIEQNFSNQFDTFENFSKAVGIESDDFDRRIELTKGMFDGKPIGPCSFHIIYLNNIPDKFKMISPWSG
jgi:hypothetical protein